MNRLTLASLAGLLQSALLAAPAAAQDEWFRFFYDLSGAGEEEPRLPGNLAFTNPTVTDTGRLYFYLQYGREDQAIGAQDFSGINLVIETVGPAVITGGRVYNHDIPGAGTYRWGTIPNPVWNPPDDSPTRWVLGSIFKVGAANYGSKNIASFGHPHPSIADSHFSGFVGGDGSPFGTTLLGYVDMAHTGEAGVGEVYVLPGTSGHAGTTILPSDFAYYGFGEQPWPNRKGPEPPQPHIVVPDAYVIPEPASILLLFAFAAISRNTRTGPR